MTSAEAPFDSEDTLPSLRERKKAKTRSILVDTAQRLFRQQGYAQTTLEQICAEADVSVGTLQRYFDSKERLALFPYYQALERLRDAIGPLGREGDVLTAWRRWVESEAARFPWGDRSFWSFVNAAPELVARRLAVAQQMQNLLATALSEEAGFDPATDLYAHVLAAALDAGTTRAYRHWVAGHRDDLVQACLEVVDFVLERFGPRCEVDRLPSRQPRAAGKPARTRSGSGCTMESRS